MAKAGGEVAEAGERDFREVRWRKEVEMGEGVEEGRRHWREGREGKVRPEAESSDMAAAAAEEEEEEQEEREGEIEVDGFVSASGF